MTVRIHLCAYRVVFVPRPFFASLDSGEAVLQFPYDDRLRVLLRAIPGRRWDPGEKAWRIPLDDPERAEALARLLAGLPGRPQVSDALARAIARRRSRRREAECVLDLARPDEKWWLSFASDADGEFVGALREHPDAYEVPAIGRTLMPLDELSERIVSRLRKSGSSGLRLTEDAEHALTEVAHGARSATRPMARTRRASDASERERPAYEIERPAPPAMLEISRVHVDPTFVLAPGHDRDQLEEFATLAGVAAPMSRRRGRDRHARLPAIRADPFCVPDLDRFLVANGTWVDPDALGLLQEIREQHAQAEGLVALSAATDAKLEVFGLGGELKPFQAAGVNYLLTQRRAFLADEQGLGKTIEALAALHADDAFPAVVLCPASLKLNWLAEIERWLPQRSARALVGTGSDRRKAAASAVAVAATATAGMPADITVVNYDIVAARLDELRALAPRALVLDESHYCKNAGAKRTKAAQQLASVVPHDGLVLALTGTPVMNRPAELISQLRIIGRLGDFGSGAQFGERFRGPDAHLRLHWHLRARCFVRRLKVDVLPQLPPKTRSVVPIELDNEYEYRFAERDVIAWLRSQPLDLRRLDAKVAAALRAERLVRLNALKLLAARGKLHAALAWIHDFCTSGERLVVFAKHREIQRAVLERFPRALHILGEDTHAARDASLREFQAPDGGAENQLIVCSIEVAGQGLTLTRASNVVFLELDWTPAKHDQAEDRCHRIGQQDAVNATYLLAADTIDETIATLLERKRAVIGAVTDGREQDEEGVVDALARELAGEPYRALRAVA